MDKFTREDFKQWKDAFISVYGAVDQKGYEAIIEKLFDTIDFLETKTERKTFAFSNICPEYKTVEQFEMFINSREQDIKNMYEAIHEARLNIARLKNDVKFDSYYRSLAKKFLGY